VSVSKTTYDYLLTYTNNYGFKVKNLEMKGYIGVQQIFAVYNLKGRTRGSQEKSGII